jgi:hypothetical protein
MTIALFRAYIAFTVHTVCGVPLAQMPGQFKNDGARRPNLCVVFLKMAEEKIAIQGVETGVLDILLRDEDSSQVGKRDDEKGDENSPTADGSYSSARNRST